MSALVLNLLKYRSLLLVLLFPLVAISPLLISATPSIIARISIFIFFLTTIIWLLLDFRGKPVIYLLAFTSFSIFVSVLRIIAITKPMMVLTPVITVAEHYSVGNFVFSTAQSYFFQTYFITYALSTLSQISISQAAWAMLFHICVVSATTCLYIARIPENSPINHFSLSYAIPFAMVLVGINLTDYRGLGTLLFMILLSFILTNNDKMMRNKAHVITAILLASGATIGSPIAATLIILIFSVVVIVNRKANLSVLPVISLAYLIYAGLSYLIYLKSYSTYALEGLSEFFRQILSFELPERIIPTKRTTLFMPIDAQIASAGYLALITLSILSLVLKPPKMGSIHNRNLKRSLLAISRGVTLLALLVAMATYIGASVMHEVVFSDIRTLSFNFLSLMMPFVLTNQILYKLIESRRNYWKLFAICIAILIALSSLRVVFTVYPKSIQDPILTVEDVRLGWDSAISATQFLVHSGDGKEILWDTKFGQVAPVSYLVNKYYNVSKLRSIECLLDRENATVFFNVHGVEYPSIYVSSEVYFQAYNISLVGNRLYDNGDYVLASSST